MAQVLGTSWLSWLRKENRLYSFLRRQKGSRYWWHQQRGHDYLPAVYSVLSQQEQAIIKGWYVDTDSRFPGGAGESCVPVLSLLQGLIMGNGIDTIVQCGHYHGYSTLLLGMYLRSMGRQNALLSIDINADVTEYTRGWVREADLDKIVRLECCSSTSPAIDGVLGSYFGGRGVDCVYIDSSHAYHHTRDELEFWFSRVRPGGFMVVHDASEFARSFCSDHAGGVHQALSDWKLGDRGSMLWMNKTVTAQFTAGSVPAYADPCGLAIIQKHISKN